MNENEATHSIGEAARILGVSVDTLRRWDENGTLPAHRHQIGKRQDRRYTAQDIEKGREELGTAA